MDHLLVLLLLGFTSAMTVCSGICLPLLTSYIVGQSNSPVKGLTSALIFSLARMFGFALLGLLAALFGHLALNTLGTWANALTALGATTIMILGGSMLVGKKMSGPCIIKRERSSQTQLAMLGLLVALLPCGPHLAVVAYIVLQGSHWVQGILMALSFGLGNMLVLLVLGTAAGKTANLVHNYLPASLVRSLCGLIIIFLGVRLVWPG